MYRLYICIIYATCDIDKFEFIRVFIKTYVFRLDAAFRHAKAA